MRRDSRPQCEAENGEVLSLFWRNIYPLSDNMDHSILSFGKKFGLNEICLNASHVTRIVSQWRSFNQKYTNQLGVDLVLGEWVWTIRGIQIFFLIYAQCGESTRTDSVFLLSFGGTKCNTVLSFFSVSIVMLRSSSNLVAKWIESAADHPENYPALRPLWLCENYPNQPCDSLHDGDVWSTRPMQMLHTSILCVRICDQGSGSARTDAGGHLSLLHRMWSKDVRNATRARTGPKGWSAESVRQKAETDSVWLWFCISPEIRNSNPDSSHSIRLRTGASQEYFLPPTESCAEGFPDANTFKQSCGADKLWNVKDFRVFYTKDWTKRYESAAQFLSVWSRRVSTTRLVQSPSVCVCVCVCVCKWMVPSETIPCVPWISNSGKFIRIRLW